MNNLQRGIMRKMIISIFFVLVFLCSCSEPNKPASENLDKYKEIGKKQEQTAAEGMQYQNPMKTIEELSQTIKQQPKNAVIYNNRGTAYHSLGQHQLAVNDYDKAVALKKDYADAYNNRGVAYYSLGKYDKAIEDFNKAISLKQNFGDAYANRGLLYLKLNKKDLGCPDAKKACEFGRCRVSKEAQSKGVCK